MEPQTELMTAIRDELDAVFPQNPIALAELSDDGRIYAELGAGYTEKKYKDRKGQYIHPVLFLCKGNNEPEQIEKLARIANYYKHKRKPPKGASYQAIGLSIAAEPGKSGREESGQVIYSCAINFKLIY